MVAEFITNHVFMCSILLFGLLSVFMQWLMTMSLKSYVKASANMKTTRKKIMINLKNQFETIYGMDYQVRNIAAYVDKYLLKLRFWGLPFSFWEKVPFLSMGVVTLIASGTAFYTYSSNPGSPVLMEILFSYGVVLVCLFLFFHIFGIKSKKQQIQIQLVDYLENYLTNRVIRNRESAKEMKILDETMEEAILLNMADYNELEAGDESENPRMESADPMSEAADSRVERMAAISETAGSGVERMAAMPEAAGSQVERMTAISETAGSSMVRTNSRDMSVEGAVADLRTLETQLYEEVSSGLEVEMQPESAWDSKTQAQTRETRDSEAEIQMLLRLVKELESGVLKQPLLEKEAEFRMSKPSFFERGLETYRAKPSLLEKGKESDVAKVSLLGKGAESDTTRVSFWGKGAESDTTRVSIGEEGAESGMANVSVGKTKLQEQIAATEDAVSELDKRTQNGLSKEEPSGEKNKSDIELLEEFVQSFLA